MVRRLRSRFPSNFFFAAKPTHSPLERNMTIANLIIAERLAEHLNAQERLTRQSDWYYNALYAVEGASEAEARAYVTGCHCDRLSLRQVVTPPAERR